MQDIFDTSACAKFERNPSMFIAWKHGANGWIDICMTDRQTVTQMTNMKT